MCMRRHAAVTAAHRTVSSLASMPMPLCHQHASDHDHMCKAIATCLILHSALLLTPE